jgi:hypothetical protein
VTIANETEAVQDSRIHIEKINRAILAAGGTVSRLGKAG